MNGGGRNSAAGWRRIGDMNKRMTAPDAAAPMGPWRVLAARCLNQLLLRAYPRLMRTIVLCGMAVAVASLPACSSVEPSERSMPRPAVAPTVGLFLNEPEAFEGYTLFSKHHRIVNDGGNTIYLIDNQGREVHRWELRFRTQFARLLGEW